MKNINRFLCFLVFVICLPCVQPAFSQTARDSLYVDKIVFDSDRDGSRQIYIMNTNGSSLRKLTSGPAENMCPSMSSDGKKIVFESKRDGNNEVYIMNSDGSGQKRLTNSIEDEYSQEFSPDGTRIFFIKYFDTRSEIWVMDTDGANLQQLTNNQFHDERPRLSPDGQTIMFISDRDGHYEIYFMDPDGTHQRRFTNSPGTKVFPAWSPDGTKIVYSINSNTGTPTGSLYVINFDGTGNTRLTNAPGVSEDPYWSPDGRSIVFQSDRDGNFEIYLMNSDGTNQQRVTTNTSWDGWPSFSHVRQAINKYLGQSTPLSTIRRFPPTNLQMLAVNGVWMWHGSPSFSPDYKEMFFVKYMIVANRPEIWHTQLVNNQWTIPEPASFGNRNVIENNPVFSQTGDTLFYYSQHPGGGGGFYQTVRQPGGAWSEPQLYYNVPNCGWTLSLTKNRNIYYEVTQTPGNDDIYRSQWINGSYSLPERLPDQINTLSNESAPFIDPNEEYLIFISKRPGGSGLHDIYISYRKKDGSWTQSVNLGTWINSDQEDGFPSVSLDGKYLFFNTARNSSQDQGYNPYWVSAAFIDLNRPIEPDTSNRVVFCSERNGNAEIYSMFPDGSDLKRLSTNQFSDLYPTFSNDGAKIAFVSDREGNYELFVMNSDGSDQHKITTTGLEVGVPEWSPDDSSILFTIASEAEAEEGDICLIQPDGTGMQVLTGAGKGSRPVWSDDGFSILFSGKRNNHFDIFLMNNDGTGIRQITDSQGDKLGARLSPDRQKIVYSLVATGGSYSQIHVMNLDGSNDVTLTSIGNRNENPSWSPDGKQIFFQTNRFGNYEIYKMDTDGRFQVNISRNSDDDFWPNTIRKSTISGIAGPGNVPEKTELESIYPNPADNIARIDFSLAKTGHIKLVVVDQLGRSVVQLADEDKTEGNYSISMETIALASGLYTVILTSSDGISAKKLIKK
jgi:TolB protein